MDYDDTRSVPPPPKTAGEWVVSLFVGMIVLAGCLMSMLLLMVLSGALVAHWNGKDSILLMVAIGGGVSFIPAIILNGFFTWLRQQWNRRAHFQDTFFPVILIGNTLLVICLILFLPGKTSQALHKYGNWMFDKRVASFLEIDDRHVLLLAGRTWVKRMAYLLEVESERARKARTKNVRRKSTKARSSKATFPQDLTPPLTGSGSQNQARGSSMEPTQPRQLGKTGRQDSLKQPPLAPLRPLRPLTRVPRPRVSRLQFRRHGSVPEVEILLGRFKTRYLWDTGASFLTLTSQMAHRLRANPGYNAPTLTVHTANGRVKTRVGLIPSLTIGGFRLTNVAFVLCNACADTSQNVVGLLGSNVQRRFRFSIDHSKGHIELQAQPPKQWRNQALDIRPFLKSKRLKGSTLNLYVRRVFRLSATLTNRAPVGVRHLLYQISYLRGRKIVGRKTLHVLPLRAGQRRRVNFMDKHAPKFKRYRMELIEGEWDREQ